MKLTNRIFKGLIALKNKQIKLEREISKGYKETNGILSAYLALLVDRHGSVRVPKELIRAALGGYRATVGTAGDDYVITVEKCDGYANAKNGKTAKTNDGYANAKNGKTAKTNDGYANASSEETAKSNDGYANANDQMTVEGGNAETAKAYSGDGEE